MAKEINPQMSLLPEYDFVYVDKAVERVKTAWMFHHHMNPDGKPMLMAFSGGKDSICLFFVCKRAAEELGIPMEQMFTVQYNITTVDPPELVQFIRGLKKDYPFIVLHHPKKTMWQLIIDNRSVPRQLFRFCCAELKETSHLVGGYTLTGVRRAESVRRSARKGFEINGKTRKDVVLLNDNAEDRRESEYCMQKSAYICNPIIDWSDEDVWNFIRKENLPYCKLYDEGFTRLGCIGCPMGSVEQKRMQFKRWPGYERAYKRAITRMLDKLPAKSRLKSMTTDELFDWWVENRSLNAKQDEQLFSEEE